MFSLHVVMKLYGISTCVVLKFVLYIWRGMQNYITYEYNYVICLDKIINFHLVSFIILFFQKKKQI